MPKFWAVLAMLALVMTVPVAFRAVAGFDLMPLERWFLAYGAIRFGMVLTARGWRGEL